MSRRVVLAIADQALAAQARALLDEGEDLETVHVVADAGALVETLGSTDVDVVLLHEELGPMPAMDLARDLGMRFQIGIVVIVRERSEDLLRSALRAGARDVIALPLSFEELQAAIRDAAAWSDAMRQRITGSFDVVVEGLGTRMIAVAGAKGGTGTSTVALHLSLEAARRLGGRSVCLVDMDLQRGDIATLLNLTHRRTLADLLEVADELSPRQLDDAVFVHPSGLRVLLAPGDGERAEDVRASAARSILGSLKTYYQVVIVDVGAIITEGNAVAVEMADEVLVVVTPDVLSARGANRLLGLWERLQIRKDGIRVVVNRANKGSEIQPDLVRKLVDAPLTKVALPAAFKTLEPAVNTGSPDRIADGPLRKALVRLAGEIGVTAARERPRHAATEASA